MRLKQIMVLVVCLLFTAVFQQPILAQDATPARTIPFTSRGFGAKLSPDGKTLVTYTNIVFYNLTAVDPTILAMHVIDISTGKERGQLSGFSDYASDVVFSSDGSQLISAHMNGDIYIWDMTSLKVLKRFQEPILGSPLIKLFPDGKHILVQSSGIPQHLLVIDTKTGAITQMVGKHFDSYLDFKANYALPPGNGDVELSAFTLSPDGTWLATATISDEVGLWSIADNQYQVVRKKSDTFGLLSIRQLSFAPDGKSLIYYDLADMQTHIWDIGAKSEKAKLAIGSDTMALSPDGKTLAWVIRGKGSPSMVSVAPLDAPDQVTVLFTLPDGLQVAPLITWLTFTADGKRVVVGGFYATDDNNQIYVLDVPS